MSTEEEKLTALQEDRWLAWNEPDNLDARKAVLDRVLGPPPPSLTGELDLPPIEPGDSPLKGFQFATGPGHEPGGGAKGERKWNIELCDELEMWLKARGAEVLNYRHHEKWYTIRQNALAELIRSELPKCLAVLETHFDDVENDSARGHDFFYLGSQKLAECQRDAFVSDFPHSPPRYADGSADGIHHRTSGRGYGYLRAMPAWACLNEPFFRSNREEWDFFKNKQKEVAHSYGRGLELFAAHELSRRAQGRYERGSK